MEDLSGRKFGRLEVLEFSHRIKVASGTQLFWKCRCDCGNEVVVRGVNLRSKRGFNISCGCAKEEYNKNRPDDFEDLTGRVFGNLTVIGFNRKEKVNGTIRYLWNCRCVCGNELAVFRNSLTSGHTKSCGCYMVQKAKARLDDLTGQRFGKLVVKHFSHIKNENTYWLCKCDCGNEDVARRDALISGDKLSCGCRRKTSSPRKSAALRSLWNGMISRCYDKDNRAYLHYGGRGIKVCDRWLKSFDSFVEDMGDCIPYHFSLDRIDVNGDYCPENCRWATSKEQNTNKRNNVRLTFMNTTLCASEWAEIVRVNGGTILARLKRGWNVEDAIFTPLSFPAGFGFYVEDNKVLNELGVIVWSC